MLGLNNRFGTDLQRMRNANQQVQNLITQGQYSKTELEEQSLLFKRFDHVVNGMKGMFRGVDHLLM